MSAKTDKDKTPELDAAANTAIGTDVPQDAPAVTGPEPASEPLESSWRGKPRFVCRECGYDSLRRDAVVAHIRMVHSGPAHLAAGYRDRRKGKAE